nr:hypothetical transcript [Hymenolepis microstoma]
MDYQLTDIPNISELDFEVIKRREAEESFEKIDLEKYDEGYAAVKWLNDSYFKSKCREVQILNDCKALNGDLKKSDLKRTFLLYMTYSVVELIEMTMTKVSLARIFDVALRKIYADDIKKLTLETRYCNPCEVNHTVEAKPSRLSC